MEIQVIDSQDDALDTADLLAEVAEYFTTPSNITEDKIQNIARLNTISVDRLTTFTCEGHRYLYFNDENNLDATTIRRWLENSAAIKDLKGEPCLLKNIEKVKRYGADPDKDILFGSGYHYLWYCGKDSTDNAELEK